MILFVGYTIESIKEQAQKLDPSANLISQDNLSDLDKITVGYASIREFDVSDFVTILEHSEEIHYISPTGKVGAQQQILESRLRYYSHRKPVYNLDSKNTMPGVLDTILNLADKRKSQDAQVWAVGCSITFGEGIEHSEIYANIIGESLRLPVSILAEPGSSIGWAADQILRSDIRKNDIVIWALTGVNRYTFFDGKTVIPLLPSQMKSFETINNIVNPRILTSDHVLYTAITNIQQVIEHSKHIGYKLVLTQLPLSDTDHQLDFFSYLTQFRFFVCTHPDFKKPYLDVGSDNEHPGPKHHQNMANIIVNFLLNENLS